MTRGKRTSQRQKTRRSRPAREWRRAWEELAEKSWPPVAENRGPWLPYRRIIE